MQDTNMKFNKEVKILKENQAEMLEMKNLESQIKKNWAERLFYYGWGWQLIHVWRQDKAIVSFSQGQTPKTTGYWINLETNVDLPREEECTTWLSDVTKLALKTYIQGTHNMLCGWNILCLGIDMYIQMHTCL